MPTLGVSITKCKETSRGKMVHFFKNMCFLQEKVAGSLYFRF
jgi:hypothetical protein